MSLLFAFSLIAVLQYMKREWHGANSSLSIVDAILGIVILAPLIETGFILLVHFLTRRWLGVFGFALVNTVLFAALHIPTQVVPVPAAMLFGVIPIDSSADLIDGVNDPGIAGQGGETPDLVT